MQNLFSLSGIKLPTNPCRQTLPLIASRLVPAAYGKFAISASRYLRDEMLGDGDRQTARLRRGHVWRSHGQDAAGKEKGHLFGHNYPFLSGRLRHWPGSLYEDCFPLDYSRKMPFPDFPSSNGKA